MKNFNIHFIHEEQVKNLCMNLVYRVYCQYSKLFVSVMKKESRTCVIINSMYMYCNTICEHDLASHVDKSGTVGHGSNFMCS